MPDPIYNRTTMASETIINPQVLADLIEKKLVDYVKFAPLARVDSTLVGRPGDTITLPYYKWAGDAIEVDENGDIPVYALEQDADAATIKKIGVGYSFTDEVALSGYGNISEEVAKQILLALAKGVDDDMLAVLEGIGESRTFTKTSDIAADVNGALELFGEDIDGEKVLLVSPADYTSLRNAKGWLPASEIAADIIVKGAVGEIAGCQVVVTNKLTSKGEAFIVKPGALATYLKRDTMVETDRDIIKKATIVTADKHFVNHIYDESKVIKIGAAG